MKLHRTVIACLLTICVSACVNDNIVPSVAKVPGTPAVNNVGVNPNVFIGGDFGSAAVIWVNGIADTLDQGDIRSIFVDGSDVYAAGWKWFNYNSIGKAKEAATYWKNGAPVVLSDTSRMIYLQDIFVADKHVYIAGFEWDHGRPVALCWKDGIPVTLSNPGATTWSAATSVYVSGTDLYVAGLSNVSSKFPRATYWKNGNPVYLSDGTSESVAKSIFVSGDDIYVAGTLSWDDINSTLLNPESSFLFGPESKCIATYWKNGKAIPLSTVGSYASSIFVNGTDVYVAGAIGSPIVGAITPFGQFDANVATYWKNGVQINLNDDNQYSLATSISVTQNGDVYLAGVINNQAAFWINGSRTYLSNDASGNGPRLRSIFLTN